MTDVEKELADERLNIYGRLYPERGHNGELFFSDMYLEEIFKKYDRLLMEDKK